MSLPEKMNKVLPTFSLEKRLWKKGFFLVIGVDEVGRGSLAGPVTAAAVAFKAKNISKIKELKIDDSKRVAPKLRCILAAEIKKCCQSYAIASQSAGTVNRVGIVKATEKAMRKAIENCQSKVKNPGKVFVLVEGFHVKYLPGVGLKYQKNIFDGDRKCISIAAASILAKVYRDNLMEKLAQNPRYKKYGWEENKGYGTKRHIKEVKRSGLTKYHRKQFIH